MKIYSNYCLHKLLDWRFIKMSSVSDLVSGKHALKGR